LRTALRGLAPTMLLRRLTGRACCCLLATSLLLSTALVQAQERAGKPDALAALAPTPNLDAPAIKDEPARKPDAPSIAEPKDDKPTPLERARAALAQSTAPALSDSEVCTQLVDVARANALPLGFFANLIWRESKFDHEAISHAGAMGIAQFMPDVADKLQLDAFDARNALTASGQLLRELFSRFNNLGLVAAAYNAGPKRVFDWLRQRTRLPQETRDYVSAITGRPVDKWVGGKKPAVFNVARQVPCRRSAEFSAAEQAERAEQLRQVAEAERVEKEREAAARREKAQQKKGKHMIATANRAKPNAAPSPSRAQSANASLLRRPAVHASEKRAQPKRALRSA